MTSTLNTPQTLTQPIANNGDKNTIPATNDPSLGQMSQSLGFPPITSKKIAEGGKAPRRADMNGALNLLSQHNFFQQNGGFYTFNQEVSNAIGGYPFGAKLWYTDSSGETILLNSLKANNTANFVTNPAYIDDGVNWESILPTRASLASTFVTLDTNQDIKGIKTALNGRNSKVSFSTATSSNQSVLFNRIYDNNNVIIGEDIINKNTDGSIRRYWRARQNTGNLVGNGIGISLIVNENANNYIAYHTIAGANITIPDSGNGIPTMDKVNSRITAIMNSNKAITESGTNYIKFNNGLLIQWGTQNNTLTTFPKPFSNTNYSLTVGEISGHKYSDGAYLTKKTETNFQYGANVCWQAIGY